MRDTLSGGGEEGSWSRERPIQCALAPAVMHVKCESFFFVFVAQCESCYKKMK